MPIYQVSYVVIGGKHPGAIVVQTKRPQVGDLVTLGEQQFIITEVIDLMPPSGGVTFLHATCRPVEPPSPPRQTSQTP